MQLSYWEYKSWFSDIDFAIIGSGIVGLNCALSLRRKYPYSKIVIFERGSVPMGASTKNAGFACYGSISEILENLENHSEEDVVALVNNRVEGLKLLRETLGDKQLDYQQNGGYELFTLNAESLLETCTSKMDYINELLEPIFSIRENLFNFQNIQKKLFYSEFEEQTDTGKMMLGLLKRATQKNILILNSMAINSISDVRNCVKLEVNNAHDISVKKVFIATNGFAKQFLNEDVVPARAQVLITKPIKNLKIKGTFHLDRGYYYFRNIEDRILFGGGRNLDFKTEETVEFGLTDLIQKSLEQLLSDVILPQYEYEIDRRWCGIMGFGKQKKPIIKADSNTIFCGARLGGMGIAIGSSVGKQLADLLD